MAIRRKIALIGAGNIGGHLASLCCSEHLGNVVLFDVPARESVAKGKALDLSQDCAMRGIELRVRGTSSWADCGGADVLIVTAGIPRKPGQSRDDLVVTNLPIIRDVARNAREHCPDAFAIVVSNPLDAMVYEFQRVSGLPAARVVGMAGVLDSARLRFFLAQEAGVSFKDIHALVLGGHGDDMVPIISATMIGGIPAADLLPLDKIQACIDRTRSGGGQIVGLMGTSAYYTPASSAIAMAASYMHDEKRMLPCAAHLTGQYGYRDIYLGVPAVIGANGVERIVEIPLTPEEQAMLDKSVASVRAVIEIVRQTKES